MKAFALVRKPGLSFFIFIAFLVFTATHDAGTELKLHDKCRRDYRIVDLDSDSRFPRGRSYFSVAEFSNWLCESEWAGRKVYVFKHEEKTGQGDTLLHEFVIDPDRLTLIKMDKTITSRNGRKVVELSQDFRDPLFDFPARTFHIDSLPAAVLEMDLAIGARNDCHILLSAENRPWHAWLVVEGGEKITVPAGEFDCLRIKIEFDLESITEKSGVTFRLLMAFMPENYIWIEKDPPHGMVKFQGRFGPPGSGSKQCHELIKIRNGIEAER